MKQVYKIKGMTCQSCVTHLDKEINKIKGIKDVNVSLINNTLTIDNIDNISKDIIIEHVKKAGYNVDDNLEHKINKKADYNLINLIINLVLLIILMFIAMGEMLGIRFPIYISSHYYPLVNSLIQLILTTIIIYNHKDYLLIGLKRLFKSPSMESLVTVGSLSALFYGIFTMIMLMIGYTDNNSLLIDKYLHNLYFESAATILVIVRLGKYIEEKTKAKTKVELERLNNLLPKEAKKIVDGNTILVDIDTLEKDDYIIVHKGDLIASDATIIEGSALINEANITGEAIPKSVGDNDEVLAGSFIVNGYLILKVKDRAKNSSIAKMINLVNEASDSKSNITKLVDKISLYFVPTIFIISIISFIVNYFISKDVSLAFNFMISTLVIACPCALGLATPIVVLVSTLVGAKHNILFKNINVLEQAKNTKVIVLDKTGTLTENKLIVEDFINYGNEEILNILYSLESFTNHPISHTICEYAEKLRAQKLEVSSFTELDGLGISGIINDINYYVGNIKFLNKYHDHKDEDITLNLYIFNDTKILGVIKLNDKIKDNVEKVISDFHKENIKVIMLTGDNNKRAKAFADKLKIDEYYSQLLPEDKDYLIKQLKVKYKNITYVGDGVNDALALLNADLGIACNNACNISIDKADVLLLNDDIYNIYNVIKLAKRVFTTIKFNLFYAFIYNMIGVLIASGIFYYSYNVKLSPMLGSLFMSLSSIFVCLNALTLKLFKFKKGENIMLLKVESMMCKHCEKRIYNACMSVEGTKKVEINLKKKLVKIDSNSNISLYIEAIKNVGYDAISC